MNRSEDTIKRHEGLRLKPYDDTVGVLTIGYGRNLEKGITQEEADYLFKQDMEHIYAEALSFSWYPGLSPVRRAVIENMLFNLGKTRFCGFRKMIRALENKDYHEAAEQMLDSKWAKQVGYRSQELAGMMRLDEWV